MKTTTFLNAKNLQLVNGNLVYVNDDVDININLSAFKLSIESPLFDTQTINLELLSNEHLCFTQKSNKIYVRNK